MNRRRVSTAALAVLTAGGLLTTGLGAAAPAAGADTVRVSGTIRDGSGQGWPLWADVTVDGVSAATDPVTGAFSLTLPPGSHTAAVTSRYPGYPATTVELSGESQEIALEIQPVHCFAPGYELRSGGVAANFDAGLPAGWTVTDEIGDGETWRFDNPGKKENLTGGHGTFAMVDGDFYGNVSVQDTSLMTPVMELTDVAEPAIGFGHHFESPAAIADVDLSLDAGSTWETVWHRTEPVDGPATELIPIPQAAGQPEVQVRFRYSEDYTAANGWQLDDVFVGDRGCEPVGGGLLTGHVTDDNTGEAVPLAGVVTAGGAATASTDGDGFYWMFVPGPGEHEVTASRLQYQDGTATSRVSAGTTATADLVLGAGALTTSVSAIDRATDLGTAASATVTVTNNGTAPTAVSFAERPVSFEPRTEGYPRTTGSSSAAVAAVPGAPVWQALPDYPIDIVENVAGRHDGRLYSVGGTSGFDRATTRGFVYDPAAGAWSPLPAMPNGRAMPAGEFVDGRFYVTGGLVPGMYESGIAAGTDVYDPATETWTTEPGAPIPVAGAGSFVLDGKLYVVGGCLSGEDEDCGTDAVFRYDPATQVWDQVADYPEPIAEPMCGAIEAKGYCAGGFLIRIPTKTSAYSYDPKMDTWTTIAPLPLDLAAAGHTVADGRLLISGGVNGGRYHDSVTAGFAYDPVTGAWSDLPATTNSLARGGSTCGFTRIGGGDGGFAERPFVETLPGYTDCGSDRDASWLSVQAPTTTLAPGESMEVSVSLEGGDGDGPGSYAGDVLIRGDDTPYDQREVRLAFDTVAPRSWGAVAGTLSGRACDGSVRPLARTEVWIEGRDESHTLRTDAAGRYVLWLPVRQNPLRVIAGDDTWIPRSVPARVAPGKVTELDLTLGHIACP
ncbi:carboxypeptidase regulatory-like domain-containing protein [Jiangella muralis]|uniref:carboxypeptidase regulatory-like domain-containing protein n=1 Tax=Jiangella muralis TaxID=702383 RepID=UPI00069E3B46|nr:carboxypeptidase regulatory-like domain-containing protein [Jiangella muralis]